MDITISKFLLILLQNGIICSFKFFFIFFCFIIFVYESINSFFNFEQKLFSVKLSFIKTWDDNTNNKFSFIKDTSRLIFDFIVVSKLKSSKRNLI